jgi:Na+/H+-dicarboxylate symporter
MFALALTRIAREGYTALVGLFRAVADTMLVLIGWILRAAPFAVFALSLPLAANLGAGLAHVLIAFIGILCLLLIVFTAALYPIAALIGRVSMWRFANALLPIQAIAFSTRSSLATLPAQIEAADRQLGLPSVVSAFVVPLGVSTFKINRIISSPTKLLFLAYLYGIHLSGFQIAAFVLTMIVMSFTTLGIPSGGSSLKTLPLYVAAGIPPEAVVIFEAVDALPDMFKTVANVTANLTVAAVVARFVPASRPAVADPRMAAERAAAAV